MENQREFHRGEVWWFRDPGSYEHEYGNSRPGVIVSSEKGCESSPTLQVVLTTTTRRYGVINVPLSSGKKSSTAMCNSLQTYSKERADSYLYTVTPEELAEIDKGLAVALGLRDVPEDIDDSQIENLENEINALKIERDMFQKCYEKALDQLVAMKLSFELEKKLAVGISTNVEKKPAPAVKTYDPGFELVDVNRCNFDELKDIGISTNVALNVIAARPFMKVDDLRLVPGMTKVGFGIIEKKVTVGNTSEYVKPKPKKEKPAPAPALEAPKKANVNTATHAELRRAGISTNPASAITKYRRKNGPFKSLDDLLNVPYCGKIFLSRHRDKLEV